MREPQKGLPITSERSVIYSDNMSCDISNKQSRKPALPYSES